MMDAICALLPKQLQTNPADDQGRVPGIDHVELADASTVEAYIHNVVYIDGTQCLTPSDYKRQKTSQYFWVSVACESNDEVYQQTVRISRCMQVSMPLRQDGCSLRLALVDFWKRPATNPLSGK